MFTRVAGRSKTTIRTSSSLLKSRIISHILLIPHTSQRLLASKIIDRTIITLTDKLQHKYHYKRKLTLDHVIARQKLPVWLLLLSPQHRYFTTGITEPTSIPPSQPPTTTTSNIKKEKQNKNMKKQNRKRKLLKSPLQSSISTMTTRDRIRLLFETNQTIPKNRFDQSMLSVAPAKDLLDLAQSRMSYLRNTIYQYWNPDYNNTSNNTNSSSSSTTTSTSSSSSQSQIRTYKAGLVIMDTRWWFWNTLFALLPAILITMYCELRGKHLMYEYHHGLEVEQLRQILGDEEFTIERANAIIAARNKELDEKESSSLWSGDLDEVVWKMIKNVVWNLYETNATIWIQLWDEYIIKDKNRNDNQDHDDRDTNHLQESTVSTSNDNVNMKTNVSNNLTAQATLPNIPLVPEEHSKKDTSTLPVSSISIISDTDRNEKQQPQNTDVLQSRKELVPTTMSDVVVNPSIDYLLHRIHQMEERLRQLQQSQGQESPSVLNDDKKDTVDQKMVHERNDAEAIRIIGQRMKDMNQSNVQNRLEIASKQKWNKYVVEVIEKEGTNTPNDNDKVHTKSFTVNSNRSVATDMEFNPNHKNNNDTSTQSSSTAVPVQSNGTASSVTDNQESFISRYNIPKLFQEVHQSLGWWNIGSKNETNENDSIIPQREVAGNNDNVSSPNPNSKDVNESDLLPCSTCTQDSSGVDPNTNTRRQPWWKLF